MLDPKERFRKYSLRSVFDGILYIVKTGSQWRMLTHNKKTEQFFGKMQIYEKFSLDNCRDRCTFGLEKCRASCWKEKYRITLSIFMR